MNFLVLIEIAGFPRACHICCLDECTIFGSDDPLPFVYWWAGSVGGEELKWRQLKQSAN